jgi:isoleucyl-tRNA synthetase
MDELWRALPGERVPSVHMALFPMGDEVAGYRDPALLERWATLGAVRDAVNLALEQKRQEQVIKANLSAQVRLEVTGDEARVLSAYRERQPAVVGRRVEPQATLVVVRKRPAGDLALRLIQRFDQHGRRLGHASCHH